MTSTARARRAATTAAWVAAGAVGATAVTGLAFASDRTSAQAPRPAAVSAGTLDGPLGGAAAAGPGRRAGVLRNLLHGQLTMRTAGGTTVVDVQRGTLAAASAGSITVSSTDGFSATYAVTSGTTVRKARQTVPASTLAVGDEVVVRASSGTAVVVRTR